MNKQNDISKPIDDKPKEDKYFSNKANQGSPSLKDSKPFIIGVVLLIIAIIVVGGIYIYQHVHNSNLSSQLPGNTYTVETELNGKTQKSQYNPKVKFLSDSKEELIPQGIKGAKPKKMNIKLTKNLLIEKNTIHLPANLVAQAHKRGNKNIPSNGAIHSENAHKAVDMSSAQDTLEDSYTKTNGHKTKIPAKFAKQTKMILVKD